MVVKNNLMKKLSEDHQVLTPFQPRSIDSPRLSFRTAAILIVKLMKRRKKGLLQHDKQLIKQSTAYKKIMKGLEEKFIKLAPEIEGRSIKIESPQVFRFFLIEI